MLKRVLKLVIASLLISFCQVVWADEQDRYILSISDHKFEPAVLEIPAGKKVMLVVKNLDQTPEEFESYELNREKVVSGKSEITVNIGPLKPGNYKFFGEFHQDTAQGQIVAK